MLRSRIGNRRALQPLLLFVTVNLLIVAAVLAASESVSANVVGVGAQNFNPTPDGLDFVTVESSKTLEPGIVNFGLFVNNAWNTLPFIDNGSQSRVKLNDTLLGLDVNFGIGLTSNWEVGASFPAILSQSVQDQGDIHGQFTQTGSTEVRLNTKLRVLGDKTQGLAVVGTVNFDRVIDDPYAGDGAGPAYTLELAADRALGKFVFGANIGRRFRTPGTAIANSPVEPLRDQWIGSLAASRMLSDYNTKIIAEIFAATPAQSAAPNETRNQTSAEMLLGAKYDWTTQLALHFGGGTALVRGVSSPDWRVYAGVNYAFGPLWGGQHEVARIPHEEDVEPKSSNAPVEEFRIGNILFEFNSAKMAPGHELMLNPLVQRLKTKPFKHLMIEGYTDSVGRAAYNLDLSRRRAESVRNYLIGTGHLPPSKIDAVGYGAENPIESNDNFQGRQANRRVEFKIDR